MTYSVKEIFYSLQGEGAQTGRPAVFCRFAGCNLWTGREEDRESAQCNFCDTDFVGAEAPDGGKFETAEELAAEITNKWPSPSEGAPYVIFTGGEPLLQLDEVLIQTLKGKKFEVAIETNGTISAPSGLDWICVSPKIGSPLKIAKGNELKFVFPQSELKPEQFEHLKFNHFFLQPLDDEQTSANTTAALNYCLSHPQWQLSLQTHKYLRIR